MIAAVIPSRMASTRFPGKALQDLHGKPVIQRVYEGTAKSGVDDVYVATPDKEIADVIRSFGGKVILTGAHDTMLDRCSEAARRLKGYSHIIVSQGDEPMVRGEMIDLAIDDLSHKITCLCRAIGPDENPQDPNMVKAIFDANYYYMYFSRSILPGFTPEKDGVQQTSVYKQVGIMCFVTEYLAMYGNLKRLSAEKSEGIDLLRYLEHGFKVIKAIETPYETQCVDTPEDLEKIRRMTSDLRTGI